MDEIKRQARENGFNSFHFSFSGGEPTMHKGYLELLRHHGNETPNTNYQSCHMTTNLSPGIPWFKKYVEATKLLNRVSITASWHRTQADKVEFKDKLVFLQENDVHATINMVMVPEMFDDFYNEALYFHDAGLNVTLKPQSDPTASRVVSGYTEEQLERLHNGMPQRDYTATRLKTIGKVSSRPKPAYNLKQMSFDNGDDAETPQRFQVELEDSAGKKWYMDQAERFNAFEFNKFKGWECNAGFQGIVIREPDGSIKRSYSCHDEPLGNIETGFKIFDKPTTCITPSCVSSVDSKIPKWKQK